MLLNRVPPPKSLQLFTRRASGRDKGQEQPRQGAVSAPTRSWLGHRNGKEAAPERCHHDIQVQGSGEAVWHSPEYDHEDAEFFRSAWISAARAARIEEAWTLYGVD